MLKTTPDGRFEIHQERTDSHDHYMSADYLWSVVDVETGKTVDTFRESYGAADAGVSDVSFSDDGEQIVATFHDGETRRYPLVRGSGGG